MAFSIIFPTQERREIGRYPLGYKSSVADFPGFRRTITLACFKALGKKPVSRLLFIRRARRRKSGSSQARRKPSGSSSKPPGAFQGFVEEITSLISSGEIGGISKKGA